MRVNTLLALVLLFLISGCCSHPQPQPEDTGAKFCDYQAFMAMDDFSGTIVGYRVVGAERGDNGEPFVYVLDIEIIDSAGRRIVVKDYYVHEDAPSIISAVLKNQLGSMQRFVYGLRFSVAFD